MSTFHHLSPSLVRDIVGAARRAGLSPVLIDVLGDPAQPEVARLRAFGRLTAALDGPGRSIRTAA